MTTLPPHPDLLTPEILLRAYHVTLFPMANPVNGSVEWFSPDPRAVIPLDGFRVPRSLGRVVRKGRFTIESDRDFAAVIRACSLPRCAGDLAWIDDRIIRAYTGLHEIGHAHSVEARLDGALVGGLYGVHIGGAFFGESMFSRPDLGGTNASKVCLVHLVRHMVRQGFTLLDTQFRNEHLDQFGCVEIPREAYATMVEEAVGREAEWGKLD
jgi:leucyl/phenylalanyl-tRNA--protein transferase